jgi:hypothetical protein
MQFSNQYKVLNKSRFCIDKYSLVPIRFEDRYDIMKWRNDQIYHLRQSEPLTKESQDNYFNNVVSELFAQEKPDQILFSYLTKMVSALVMEALFILTGLIGMLRFHL